MKRKTKLPIFEVVLISIIIFLSYSIISDLYFPKYAPPGIISLIAVIFAIGWSLYLLPQRWYK